MSDLAPEYVAARRVLLDALTALAGHLHNLILVGAQAVYHHTGDAELNVPLMTTDADLAVNVDDLAGVPEIGASLRVAGFTPGPNPGHWVTLDDIAVDLMVVPHQAGATRPSARAARLAPHEKLTARITRGLEPALIDNDLATIAALDSADHRSFELRVAGPAALMTAKAIKIGERMGTASREPDRLKEKDALDVFRILQVVDIATLVQGFATHQQDEHADAVTSEALQIYRMHALSSRGVIPLLAARAAQGDPTVAPAFAVLVEELMAAI